MMYQSGRAWFWATPREKVSLTEPNTLFLDHRYNSAQCHSPPFYYTTRTKQDCSPIPNHATHFRPQTRGARARDYPPGNTMPPRSLSGPLPVISVTADKYCPHLLCSGIYAISHKTPFFLGTKLSSVATTQSIQSRRGSKN